MRRILAMILLAVCICTIGVSAATQITQMSGFATVSSDESCQVTVNVTLHLEQVEKELSFPLPKNASHVTVNGARASVKTQNDILAVNLNRVIGSVAGDVSFTINYRLTGLVEETEAGLQLQLPLLSGFAYPVEALEFSVSLPGAVEEKPAFTSGYHQASIEKDLLFSVSGNTITGTSQKQLKDHETLTMTLPVTEELFPQTTFEPPSLAFCNTAMAVCAGVALLYWLLFLRNLPPLFGREAAPPEGHTAGTVGSMLYLQGADLSMLVFSWAQMGYLKIRQDARGIVTLHRQMEMGNERSAFERRAFENLFGKRTSVDTTGLHYAHLCKDYQRQKPPMQSYLRKYNGSTKVFGALSALIGLFAGVGLGITVSAGAALQWVMGILLGGLGLLSGWHIQKWAVCFLLRSKTAGALYLAIGGVWLLLGLVAKQFSLALWMVLSQLLAGLLAAHGGKRTQAGKAALEQLLGLRRYLRRVPRQEIERILESNPDYFHSVIPYALALGVDQAFARHFGKLRLPECPYLIVPNAGPMTAMQWSGKMRQILHSMEARKRQLPLERLMEILYALRK